MTATASLPLWDSDPLPSERRARERWLKEAEEALASRLRGKLTAIVREAWDDFTATLTAAGDIHALDSIPGKWGAYVDAEVGDALGDVFVKGVLATWEQASAKAPIPDGFNVLFGPVMNDAATAYQAQAVNRIKGVGENLWGSIKSKTTAAVANGTTTEDLKKDIERLTSFSEFRADTIARTETHLAAIQGDRQAADALGQYGPTEHVWVAVMDARTRDAHAEANDQCVPYDEPFIVDGEQVLHPGDGSEENSINCRCWEEYLWPGDTRPDGTTVEGPTTDNTATLVDVDRDGMLEVIDAIPRSSHDDNRAFEDHLDAQLSKNWDLAQRAAREHYVGSGYRDMNNWLRGIADFTDDYTMGKVRDFQMAFANPAITEPLPVDVVYRGEVNGVGNTFAVGDRFQDKGFVSTSQNFTTAYDFSGSLAARSVDSSRTLYRIVPSETTKTTGVIAGNHAEYEWVLPPNSTFRVKGITQYVNERGVSQRLVDLVWES